MNTKKLKKSYKKSNSIRQPPFGIWRTINELHVAKLVSEFNEFLVILKKKSVCHKNQIKYETTDFFLQIVILLNNNKITKNASN